MHLSDANQSRFHIVNVTLPKASAHEEEVVPMLIDRGSALPIRLATRWIVRSRRLAVGEKRLRDNLYAASLLYAFCEDKLHASLDEHAACGLRLRPHELDLLEAYLREGDGVHGTRSLARTGQLAADIELFLRWLAKPLDRGGPTVVPNDILALYYVSLAHTFKDLRRYQSRGKRIPPLAAEADVALRKLIDPRKKSKGEFERPFRFSDACP